MVQFLNKGRAFAVIQSVSYLATLTLVGLHVPAWGCWAWRGPLSVPSGIMNEFSNSSGSARLSFLLPHPCKFFCRLFGTSLPPLAPTEFVVAQFTATQSRTNADLGPEPRLRRAEFGTESKDAPLLPSGSAAHSPSHQTWDQEELCGGHVHWLWKHQVIKQSSFTH